ncbi:MAG TPA: hypothetical protein VLB80_03040, partial [Candidatus Babeliales bacterium]|nr:hypothetical protein [Candidatus Babeliales bacterium]
MVLILLLMIISFFQFTLADQTLVNQAARVLDSGEYYVSAPSIIGDREWKELQLDRVVTTLDRTTTSFGKWGLKKLLWPISDKKQLLQRKKIITFLVDHPEDMRLFQKQLEKVRDVERSLLSYWDKNDVLNRSCEKFYFSMVGLHDLNKSNSALNISTFLEMFNSCERLLM